MTSLDAARSTRIDHSVINDVGGNQTTIYNIYYVPASPSPSLIPTVTSSRVNESSPRWTPFKRKQKSPNKPNPPTMPFPPENSEFIRVRVEDLTTEDIIIAVMGPTGTGKSSFINKATGSNNTVSHNLTSCTAKIEAVKFQCIERSDLNVVFVDTPGFDDTHKTDTEILSTLADWLQTTYGRNITLAGILYFHSIVENRMEGTAIKNVRLFRKLCGKQALKNVILTTTMWDELHEESKGIKREMELRTVYWKPMIDRGATIARYRNTTESAWEIVNHFLDAANDRYAVRLQEEMVDMEMQLNETAAGQELFGMLRARFNKQQECIQKLRKGMKGHTQEEEMTALRDAYEEAQKEIAFLIAEMQMLEVRMGKRILRTVLAPLGGLIRRRW